MHDEPLQIVWTDRAATALEEAHRYVASDNPSAADSLIEEIHARVSQLSTLPDLGIKRHVRRVHGTVRELVVRRYRVFYRPEPELKRVLILLVWHSSRRDPNVKDF